MSYEKKTISYDTDSGNDPTPFDDVKHRVCRHFVKGKCWMGIDCGYMHVFPKD